MSKVCRTSEQHEQKSCLDETFGSRVVYSFACSLPLTVLYVRDRKNKKNYKIVT
jgi:hypothetical protein